MLAIFAVFVKRLPSTTAFLSSLLLIPISGIAQAQQPIYGNPQQPSQVYIDAAPNLTVGSDGRVFYRQGNVLIETTDPAIQQNQVVAPPGSNVTSRLGDSAVIQDTDGKTRICTPVAQQVICH